MSDNELEKMTSIEDYNSLLEKLKSYEDKISEQEKQLKERDNLIKERDKRIKDLESKISRSDSVTKYFIKYFEDYVDGGFNRNMDGGFSSVHRCSLIPFIGMYNLSVGALGLFNILCLTSQDGSVIINKSYLTSVLHKSRNTISEYLNILEDNKFIKNVDGKKYMINSFLSTQRGNLYNQVRENKMMSSVYYGIIPNILSDRRGKTANLTEMVKESAISLKLIDE